MNSCIEQTFPESSTATADQVANSPAGMQAMMSAIVGYINTYNSYGQGYNFDFGYSAFGMTRETMCEDFFVYNSNYDYFSSFGKCLALAENSTVNSLYYYYYKFLNNTNNLIRLIDPETATETNRQYLGIAKTFRALIYMDISRFFEYKKTGIAKLDNEAEANKIYGLTVPIIYENITESEARDNPRVPFYTMYEYILNDLDDAEEYLKDYTRPAKNMPDQTIIYGLKARLWLEMGTRFEKYPNDLSALTQNVDLGWSIISPKIVMQKHAEYDPQSHLKQWSTTVIGIGMVRRQKLYGRIQYHPNRRLVMGFDHEPGKYPQHMVELCRKYMYRTDIRCRQLHLLGYPHNQQGLIRSNTGYGLA